MKKIKSLFPIFLICIALSSCTNDEQILNENSTQAGDVRISARSVLSARTSTRVTPEGNTIVDDLNGLIR